MCKQTLLLKGTHHCPGVLSKYHGEEKMACVQVIIVPDDMNWDAETNLPTFYPLCLLITKLIAVWHEIYPCIILYRKCFSTPMPPAQSPGPPTDQ
jgi:hypothetical protein